MHVNLPSKYYFINKFDTNNIGKLDKNTGIIFRNYSSKTLNEEIIIKIKSIINKIKVIWDIRFFLFLLLYSNLNFFQTTDSGFDEINSKGRLVRNKDFIEITIGLPTKEKYILRDSIIEIHDYEFNQSQIIEINDDNSFLFNFLTNGIDADEINNMNENSFTILKNDNQFIVNIISESSFSISYNDNMNYKNLIVFEVLK